VGYWWPPGLWAYDPAPRPLAWHVENGVRVPDEEDRLLFGIGVTEGAIGVWGAGPMWVRHETAGKYHGTNPGLPRTFLKVHKGQQIKTDDDLLANYNRLIDERAPGDPPQGGLAADSVDSDGTVRINYWDLADDRQPQRKQVVYRPVKGGVEVGVLAWNRNAQEWGGEGFDFERDFTGAVRPILEAINVVSTAIVSIFATPAVGAAWSAAFGAGLKMSDAQRAGRLTVEGALGEAFGVALAFGVAAGGGELLASEAGKLFSGGVYKSIGVKLLQLKDFAASLQSVAKEAGTLIPKLRNITIAQVLDGKIPPELAALTTPQILAAAGASSAVELPGSPSNEWALAVAGFAALQAEDPAKFYSWRKLSSDPSLFDASAAVLLASDDAEKASAEWQARTFIESREQAPTFRQALARAKQTVAQRGAVDAPKTWRQTAEAMGLNPALVTAKGSGGVGTPASLVAIGAVGLAAAAGTLWWYRRQPR
jgi:hypothetical protein